MSLTIFYLKDKTDGYALGWVHFEQTLADSKVERLTSATGFDHCWFVGFKMHDLLNHLVLSSPHSGAR